MERQISMPGNQEQQFDIRNGVLINYIGQSIDVSVPCSVKEISSTAFKNCCNISSINIPDSVMCINKYAFASCSALKKVKLGFGIRIIPQGCFAGLRQLEEVTLTDNIESIEDFAFNNCEALKRIDFLVKKYRAPITAAEKGKAFEAMLSGGKAAIEYVDYADAVPTIKRIGKYAFMGCVSLDYTAIKETATNIETNAFDKQGCESTNSPITTSITSEVITEPSPCCLIEGYDLKDGQILNCSTGQTIPDRNISGVDIDSTSISILRRAGQIYGDTIALSQLLRIRLEQLNDVKRASTEQIDFAIKQVADLLEALFAPPPIIPRCFVQPSTDTTTQDQTTKSITVSPDNTAIADEHAEAENTAGVVEEECEEIAAEQTDPLICGFEVIGGCIFRTDTQQQVEDAPITVLNLSTRAYNCMNRTRAYTLREASDVMISDVMTYSPDALRNIRNMGPKTADEIIEKIEQYLGARSGAPSESVQQAKNTLAPNYEVVDGVIINITNQLTVLDTTIDCLNLSVRATNSLRRGQICRLSELIVLTQQQLRNFSNMGTKTIEEITEFVPKYLKANETEKTENPCVVNTCFSAVALPELDPDVPVLAADYAVVEDAIISRKDYIQIADASIDVLNLSVRANNCLEKSGLTRISCLVGLPYEEFRRIRNLGVLSANEIQEKLGLYLSRCHSSAESGVQQGAIYSSADVLRIFKEHEYESLSITEICEALADAKEEDVLQLVEHLLQEGSIENNGEQYNIYHHSFFDSVLSLAEDANIDERAMTVLQMRMDGATLEEAGQHFGITRERIRQIEKKAMDKITRRGRIHFEEDKFAYFFTTYTIDKEMFFDYLKESERLWYYLNIRYNKGNKALEEAFDDPKVAVELRRAADRYIHRNYVQIDGVYIPGQRGDLEDYVVERFCKEEVSLEEFFARYEAFLQEYELDDEKFQLTPAVRASRSNRLCESNRLLWKQNQRLRYYDVQGGDYTELLEVLNLGQYANVELSTRKFLQDYPEVMARYDLRDEYEVHNLLKKIHAETENSDLVFSRMPNIIFGTFDRDAAVKEILFALAPISQDDLAEAISQEYGTRADTIKANWLSGVSEYYHQGMYSVDYEDMPEEHIQKLQAVLTEDFYFLTELRRIYNRTIPNADMSLLSTYNLKKMGFLIGNSYVLQHYDTAEAYFNHLLAGNDVVDITAISKRFTSLSIYSAQLADLKRNMEIIEFEPFQYINIRRLERLGFDKSKLRAYADRVWSFLVDDEYFTIQSLKNAGFEDELDVLGFGDLFYSSLLREDPRFTWQRVGKAVVLNPKRVQFTVHDFLVDRVTKEESIDVDDFVAMLQEEYGIVFERQDVLTHVKGSDVYYDAIMGKLYADYATYFEEV